MLCDASSAALAESPPLPRINAVLVTASDVEPAEDAVERLTEAAEYTENFFVKRITLWDYEPHRKRILDQTENGQLRGLFSQTSKTRQSEA